MKSSCDYSKISNQDSSKIDDLFFTVQEIALVWVGDTDLASYPTTPQRIAVH